MADITFECPECKQHLIIDVAEAASKVQCPTCRSFITVPASSGKTPPIILRETQTSAFPRKQTAKLHVLVLKLIAGSILVVLAILGISMALDYYHRSQSKFLFDTGGDKLAKGDYDGALHDFSTVIKYRPDFADAYFARGCTRSAKSDFSAALEDFNKVAALRPGFPEVYCWRGTVEYDKGEMAAAFDDFNHAIQLNPSDAVAFAYRGNITYSRGDYDGALGDYEKAIELKPDFTEAIKSRERLKAEHQKATPEPSLVSVMALFQSKLNGVLSVKDEQGFTHNVSAAQYFFDCIHPIGTAKSITVIDAVLNKDGNGKIQSVGLRLVLNWEGPLQTGSTTFQTLYDDANDMFGLNISVIKTDGITRENINDFANGFVIGAQIHDALKGD